ncbi:MAG: hypothetical protein K2N30_04470 [Clostridia bacterium]|nr:hypothetical protein [Clostridia bacterium]
MKVKEILIPALRYAGREDAADALEKGEAEGETAEAVKTALYCFNAVEDELARCYFSLTATENLHSADGRYYFKTFSLKPVKIISVKAGGADVKYALHPEYLECGQLNVSVTYGYVPAKRDENGESAFSENAVPARLIAAGTASEYCLINGDTGRAELWENVYREEIEGVRRRALIGLKLPPRRWV